MPGLDYAMIEQAAARIAPFASRTPVLRSRQFDALAGATVFFKCENFQRTGSFKFRGACNALASLDGAQRSRGVVAYSSGNHAQAVALAARLHGIAATIVMPADAPAVKLAATRGYGAEVITYDRLREDREAIAQRLVADRGALLLPPFDHLEVMAGQGTAARELIEDAGPLDLLVAPVGGGGLISGCATAAAALAPSCEAWGVEPAAGDDARQSLVRGEIVRITVPDTIADGAQTTAVGKLTFPVMRSRLRGIVTVDDAALRTQMRFFAERMKIVVEPTGCLPAAALLAGRLPARGRRVGVIVSGGNADAAMLAQALREG